jgi:hypothetical protein
MSLKSDGIDSVRAFDLPAGIRTDGQYVKEPNIALIKWRSTWSDKFHQVYINGLYAGTTLDYQQRQLLVPVPTSPETPVRIEVFAVDSEYADTDFSSELDRPPVDNGRVTIILLRSQNLPMDAAVDIYFDNGIGQIDYDNPITDSPIRIWPAWQDKAGLGMSRFGLSDFGWDSAAAVGFGNGSFHYSTSAPMWKPGKYGSALEFDSERCIDCGTGKLGWDITNEISVVALVNQSASQGNTIFTRSGFVRPCRLSAYNNGRFKWWIYTDGTNCVINSTSVHATDGSEFVHVAGIWHSGNGKLYVNGVQEASESSSSGSLSFHNDSQPVGIGGTYEGSNYYYCFNGRIEYVFIYNRALSAEEVRWLYRQPFAMFARPIRPALIPVTTATVSLAGSASATSTGYAALNLAGSSSRIELSWLKEALFNGMTSNSFKLGTTLNLGWFWSRITGCSALYRGPNIEQVNFDAVLTVAEINAVEISSPDYLGHENNSTYFYIVRRYNNCGYQEHTLAASVKISLDANRELDKPKPNKIFAAKVEQVDIERVLLTWFYCPLEQSSHPIWFNIYYDDGSGQVDYENPLAVISYQGRKFYSHEIGSLETGKYLFTIRAKNINGNENGSLAHLAIELEDKNPDPIKILQAKTS